MKHKADYYTIPYIKRMMSTRALPGAVENVEPFDLWKADPWRAHQMYRQDETSARMDEAAWKAQTVYGGRP